MKRILVFVKASKLQVTLDIVLIVYFLTSRLYQIIAFKFAKRNWINVNKLMQII